MLGGMFLDPASQGGLLFKYGTSSQLSANHCPSRFHHQDKFRTLPQGERICSQSAIERKSAYQFCSLLHVHLKHCGDTPWLSMYVSRSPSNLLPTGLTMLWQPKHKTGLGVY